MVKKIVLKFTNKSWWEPSEYNISASTHLQIALPGLGNSYCDTSLATLSLFIAIARSFASKCHPTGYLFLWLLSDNRTRTLSPKQSNLFMESKGPNPPNATPVAALITKNAKNIRNRVCPDFQGANMPWCAANPFDMPWSSSTSSCLGLKATCVGFLKGVFCLRGGYIAGSGRRWLWFKILWYGHKEVHAGS